MYTEMEILLAHASVGTRARQPQVLLGATATARALRLLLLMMLALVAVEFLFGSIVAYNAIQPSLRLLGKAWPKLSTTVAAQTENPIKNASLAENGTVKINFDESRVNNCVFNVTAQNMTLSNSGENTPLLIGNSMKNIITYVTEDRESKPKEPVLPLCETPPDLGPISVNKTDMELELVEKKYPEVHWGGRYAPPNCTAKHKVAIIVPFRDRKQHLAIFLNHMHPFLMRQQIEYGIFIIEQEGNSAFNRAKLMNVGFAENQKQKAGGWKCFIFHDVDLLPLDLRNIYSCTRQPRHMSASINKYNFQLQYETIFGGVSAMTKKQFEAVNGFSNKYWGWGSEDDDMFNRITKMGFHVARYKMSIARYAMLDHKKSPPNPKRLQLMSKTSKMSHKDGLSTLKYEVVQVTHHHLYTHLLVNINERRTHER